MSAFKESSERDHPDQPQAPGPKGIALLGSLLKFSHEPLEFSTECAREYGDVVFFRLGSFPTYMFNHPSLIEEVLCKQSENFIKDYTYRALRSVFGDGLLLSEGDYSKRHRRLMQPAFHKERIEAYAEAMTAYTDRMLTTWQDGETRDLHQEMMQLTLKIIAKTLCGVDVARVALEIGEALDAIMIEYFRQSQTLFLFPRWLPTPGNWRYHRATQQLDKIVGNIIEQRRQSPKDDLLSMLLQVEDEEGKKLTDQELRDEVMTMLLAGHETTANTLSWTLMLLSQNPEVEAKLLQELYSVLKGQTPTVEDLSLLRYTKMVLKESMRLYPPAWGLGREVIQECRIGDYQLQPGTVVYISQWVMHRDPRFFENSEQFYPERWANNLEQNLPRCTYFPFGDGSRSCIGRGFAMMEATLILAMAIQKFRLAVVPNSQIELLPSITLRPKTGMQMIFIER